MTIDLNEAGLQLSAGTQQRADNFLTGVEAGGAIERQEAETEPAETGSYDRNPVTGAERPDDFAVHDGNPLFYTLESLTAEIPWLQGEGYEWMDEDLVWSRFLVVSVALAAREPLGELLEGIVSAYRMFEAEEFHDPRSRMSESKALLGQVNFAAWQAVRRGVSEDEMLASVRKVVAGWKDVAPTAARPQTSVG